MVTPEQFAALEVDMQVSVSYRDAVGNGRHATFKIFGEVVALNKRKRYISIQTKDNEEYLIFEDELIAVQVLK